MHKTLGRWISEVHRRQGIGWMLQYPYYFGAHRWLDADGETTLPEYREPIKVPHAMLGFPKSSASPALHFSLPTPIRFQRSFGRSTALIR